MAKVFRVHYKNYLGIWKEDINHYFSRKSAEERLSEIKKLKAENGTAEIFEEQLNLLDTEVKIVKKTINKKISEWDLLDIMKQLDLYGVSFTEREKLRASNSINYIGNTPKLREFIVDLIDGVNPQFIAKDLRRIFLFND